MELQHCTGILFVEVECSQVGPLTVRSYLNSTVTEGVRAYLNTRIPDENNDFRSIDDRSSIKRSLSMI